MLYTYIYIYAGHLNKRALFRGRARSLAHDLLRPWLTAPRIYIVARLYVGIYIRGILWRDRADGKCVCAGN